MVTISFAISVCSEWEELDVLLNSLYLQNVVKDEDEIVIIVDESNTNEQVIEIINKWGLTFKINTVLKILNKNFASFKNYLKENCTKDWIVQIDADEVLSEDLANSLHDTLEMNQGIELYYIPRINIVQGITQEDIARWGWKISDSEKYINYPDYQARAIINKPEIYWENKVHEVIKGAKVTSAFPPDSGYDLIHIKTIERQRKQNEFYNSI